MPEIGLTAVGDICLRTTDGEPPFLRARPALESGDLRFANLETVLAERGTKVRKAYLLHTDPSDADHLSTAGFDVVSVANNHALDLGPEGLAGTLDALRRRGIAAVGDPGSGSRITCLERNGLRVGFLGYCEEGLRWSWRPAGEADDAFDPVIRDVLAARDQCDVLVVSLHWGIEGALYPSPRQIRFARRLVDSGVHLVLGHHPHVLQGIERHGRGLIAYSLGNFQFPAGGARERQTLILRVRMSAAGVIGYDIVPARIGAGWTPNPLAGDEGSALREHVARISAPIREGRITEDWWLARVAGVHLTGNLEAWGRRIRRYGALEVPRLAKWCLAPFQRRCIYRVAVGLAVGNPSGVESRSALPPGPSSAANGAGHPPQINVVEERHPGGFERWTSARASSPFVTPSWLEAFRGRDRIPVYFRFVRGSETVGAIGGLLVRPRTRSLERVPLLRTLFFFSGPVVVRGDEVLISRCVERIRDHAAARGIPAVVCRSWDYPCRYSCDRRLFRTVSRVEYIVDLRGGPERLLARMRKNRRLSIRKASRGELTCGLHRRKELLSTLINLLERTRSMRQRKGYADYDYHYITYTSTELLGRLIDGGIARVACAEVKGEILAASLIVSQGRRAYAVLAGQSQRGSEIGAGDLLYYEVMRQLGNEGVETLSLGGNPVSGDEGLRFYKTSLGATPHTCTGVRSITPRARMVRALGYYYRRVHARFR